MDKLKFIFNKQMNKYLNFFILDYYFNFEFYNKNNIFLYTDNND